MAVENRAGDLIRHTMLPQMQMTNAGMRSEVLVYNGEGAGTRSVQSALQTLRSTLRLHAPDRPSLKVLPCPECRALLRDRCGARGSAGR